MGIIAVARQAGVSITTVSRVFNTPSLVAPGTRSVVEAAALALGYRPNLHASALRTQRSRMLGVLLPSLHDPVFAHCLSGIAEAAANAGYAVIPLATGCREELEQRAVQKLAGHAADGLILTVTNADHSSTLDALQRSRQPYVLAYNRHPDHPCVSVNGHAAMRQLVDRLRDGGHERIAMASGPLADSDRAQQRHAGYAEAMRAAGLTAELIEVPSEASALDTLGHRLRRTRRPTAVVCSSDLMAMRCLRAAALAGLRVPADVSVVGFDGSAFGADLVPSLASIAQPDAEIGRRCVHWLAECLARSGLPRAADSPTLPHTLQSLESIGPAPAPTATSRAPAGCLQRATNLASWRAV